MKISEILFEAYDPFKNNPNVIDLRDPSAKSDTLVPYTDEHKEILKKHGIEFNPKGRLVW